MIWGSRGSKSRLAKAAGAEPAGQMRDEKLHAVVARSTFQSQNVQSTPFSDHFWKLRCRKSARRCGAKHMSKSKCTKHIKAPQPRTASGSSDVKKVHAAVARSTCRSQNVQSTQFSDHLEVEMSRKCAPLWRKARFQVKMLKTPGVWTTFGGSDVASLRFTTLHYTTIRSTTLHYITLHNTPQHYNYNYTTKLHHTPLHSTTLNYTKLH